MSRYEMLERITSIFHNVFDDENIVITEKTSAADIEDWDSLIHVILITEIETEFECKFSTKNVLTMQNVGEMIDTLTILKKVV